jgi:hypothetical protein
MKPYRIISCFTFLLLLVGCAPETYFYWGDYSETYYSYKKSPSDETMTKHINSLIDIVNTSSLRNKQVPPGVYAELGFYLIKKGKEKEGFQYFDKEIRLYPESRIFIEKLKSGLQSGGDQ